MIETPITPPRQKQFSLLLTRPWEFRLIATLGIVIMTGGLYAQCAGREVIFASDPASRHSEIWTIGNAVSASLEFFHAERLSLPLQLGFSGVYAVLTLGGLALIPLLWQTFSSKRTILVRWTYITWFLLLTILALAGLPALWQFMSQPPPGPSPQTLTLVTSSILPGVIVFPLGLLINCVALALMRQKPLDLTPPAPASRTGWQWAASLALTAGALLWGIGFYLLPEAVTATCPPITFSVTQFAHGACAGLDSDQVLTAASYARPNPIAQLLSTVGLNFELLVAAGCITMLGGWMRQRSTMALAWLAVWPMLAFGVALVALQGVSAVAQRGFKLTAATVPDWRIGSGMVVTFVGLGLVALGQLVLWRELMSRKRPGYQAPT